MKIYRIVAALLVLTTTACNDWLEILPKKDLVQDEFWKTKEDVKSVVNGIYKKAAQMDYVWFMLGELRADNVMVTRSNQKDHWAINVEGKLLPENSLTNWQNYYEIISRCNYVLEFAPGVLEKDDTFEEVALKGYLSEAYFMRALTYFYLVRTYGEVPLVTISAKTDNQNFSLPKVSSDSVLNFITRDLIANRLYVTDEYGNTANNKGRASKAAFDALLADIYLWREDYANCVYYCDQIDSVRYALVPGDFWFENFYPGNSLESIFELQLGSINNTPNKMWEAVRGTNSYYAPVREAIYEDLYGSGDDIFIQEIFRAFGTTDLSGFAIWKYIGTAGDMSRVRSGSDEKAANWIFYRVADVIWMKAEALVQLGRYDEALAEVNVIRERARVPLQTPKGSLEDWEDMVLQERNLELAFEGKRWWDLMRMAKRRNYERKREFIEIVTENISFNSKLILQNRLLDPNSWYWPIYQGELERNLELEQNPYYVPFTK